MDDLTRLRAQRDEIIACVTSLEAGRRSEEVRYVEYGDHLANARARIEVGRSPEYNPEKLQEERERIQTNLASIDTILQKERAKLILVEAGIQANLDILKAHGVLCEVGFNGVHDWEVLEYFDEIGRERQWRRRHCKRCPTEQRLGHGG